MVHENLPVKYDFRFRARVPVLVLVDFCCQTYLHVLKAIANIQDVVYRLPRHPCRLQLPYGAFLTAIISLL